MVAETVKVLANSCHTNSQTISWQLFGSNLHLARKSGKLEYFDSGRLLDIRERLECLLPSFVSYVNCLFDKQTNWMTASTCRNIYNLEEGEI